MEILAQFRKPRNIRIPLRLFRGEVGDNTRIKIVRVGNYSPDYLENYRYNCTDHLIEVDIPPPLHYYADRVLNIVNGEIWNNEVLELFEDIIEHYGIVVCEWI